MGKISFALLLLHVLLFAGCTGKGSVNQETETGTETIAVPDTGYTGIKEYFSGNFHVKDVTYKNGVRHGEMKTYYQGGQLYHTFWYENDMREDTARWYYLEGQVFRTTPYKNDTIHGTQIQYYRDGRVKAKLNYIKGLRTPFLEEYTRDGKLIGNYPGIEFSIIDNYNTTGRVRINLELSQKERKVKFYRGEFSNGVFDTSKCRLIPTVNGKTYLDLKKTGSTQPEYVGIIAAILTDFQNNHLAYKRIQLPYQDIN
jgi:hypothetical protein